MTTNAVMIILGFTLSVMQTLALYILVDLRRRVERLEKMAMGTPR